MTFEAVLRHRTEHPIDFTVSNTTGIEKGTLCKLTDARTAAISDTEGEACSGVTAREKIASDGRTQLAIFQRGIFDMYASGAIIVGAPVMSAGVTNNVKQATVTRSGSMIIGHALEAASDKETFQVMLNVGAGSAGAIS